MPKTGTTKVRLEFGKMATLTFWARLTASVSTYSVWLKHTGLMCSSWIWRVAR